RDTTSTLDCFAAYRLAKFYNGNVSPSADDRLRKDGQGEALTCPGALRRDGGRGLGRGYWAWIASRGSQ
ncbi:MAG: hypothetical protein LBM98_08860, partial [Oscillospiraceae bacterium]|nr:hypothetical protein [Oscillospiraceae bacterium]